jgi:hypothetical protein
MPETGLSGLEGGARFKSSSLPLSGKSTETAKNHLDASALQGSPKQLAPQAELCETKPHQMHRAEGWLSG